MNIYFASHKYFETQLHILNKLQPLITIAIVVLMYDFSKTKLVNICVHFAMQNYKMPKMHNHFDLHIFRYLGTGFF